MQLQKLTTEDMLLVLPEEWLPIPGYEGLYAVSNTGRIKRLGGKINRIGNRGNQSVREKILRNSLTKSGYRQVSLSKENKAQTFRICRLVAKLFVDNPNPVEYDEVNHDDLNKLNDHHSNLCWTSRLKNMQHAFANLNIKRYKNSENPLSKKVGQFNMSGELVQEWPSINEIRRQGWSYGIIADYCRKGGHNHKGFIWKYI